MEFEGKMRRAEDNSWGERLIERISLSFLQCRVPYDLVSSCLPQESLLPAFLIKHRRSISYWITCPILIPLKQKNNVVAINRIFVYSGAGELGKKGFQPAKEGELAWMCWPSQANWPLLARPQEMGKQVPEERWLEGILPADEWPCVLDLPEPKENGFVD